MPVHVLHVVHDYDIRGNLNLTVTSVSFILIDKCTNSILFNCTWLTVCHCSLYVGIMSYKSNVKYGTAQ